MLQYSIRTSQGKKMIKECGRASCACFEKYVYNKQLPMKEYLEYKDCSNRRLELHKKRQTDPRYPFLL